MYLFYGQDIYSKQMNFGVISPAISFVTFLLSQGSVRVEPVGWQARLLTSRSAPLATAVKQDEYSISSVKTSVKSQLCYWLMIYCWMSQQL